MDQNARCAFVIAQAACASAELCAMQNQNTINILAGTPLTFSPADFMAVQDKYVIGHNAVISYLGEG